MHILVVDDHQLFLDGLRYILYRLDTEVQIDEVGNAASAFECLESGHGFDLILVDLHMPGLGGMALLHRLRDRRIGLPIVVISGETDTTTILDCLEIGALGFIPKSHSAEEMLGALRQVLDGDVYCPAGIDPDRAKTDNGSGVTPEPGITRRQFDVLRLLALGYSNRKIASTLFITEHTVKAHIGVLFRILEVANRTECVRVAEDRGLLAGRL